MIKTCSSCMRGRDRGEAEGVLSTRPEAKAVYAAYPAIGCSRVGGGAPLSEHHGLRANATGLMKQDGRAQPSVVRRNGPLQCICNGLAEDRQHGYCAITECNMVLLHCQWTLSRPISRSEVQIGEAEPLQQA